ncbi:FtsX-like permease family protein [Conexibacter sp. DBS9H8]|uniref:FtsX-like permease family protein n=1 Tax=Conexibacter sp. DBS9H8 TaxID=2937801 RepID=UPI0020109F7D|nr:ABC transporter permease [Conexibacter sp. DBS9H8]
MTRAFTFRALLTRLPRLALSALTVAFGVAILTGALVFGASTRAAYHQLFTRADGAAQLIVSPREPPGTGLAGTGQAAETPSAPAIGPTTVAAIAAVPGVADAAGQLIAPATIVGANGRPLASSPATVAMSVLPRALGALTYRAGHAPTNRGEVAVDAATAAQQHWRVGDAITITTGAPAARFRISGITAVGAGGGERIVLFTADEAARLYQTRSVSQVDIRLGPGVSVPIATALIGARLPADLTVQSLAGAVSGVVARVSTAFSTLSGGLDGFSAVALLIGALVIFTTFATTASDRREELALLRALGATRTQVLVSGLLDAAVIGLLGAILGVLLGPLIALAIHAGFAAAGTDVPDTPLRYTAAAVGIGLGAGVLLCLLAALGPALAARRAAPVQALQASRGAGASGRRRWLAHIARAALAAGTLAAGVLITLGAGGDLRERLVGAGVGAALILAGGLAAGPVTVRAVVALAGGFRRRDPIVALARAHTAANSRSVALGGSSLMIGITLALVLSVYVAGLRSASATAIRQTVIGDLAIESAGGAAPIPASSVRAVAAVPDLAAVSALKTLTAQLPGAGSVQVAGVDPTSWPAVYRFHFQPGASASLAALAPGEALIEADTARAAHLRVGSRFTITGPQGQNVRLRVAGIYRDAGLLGGITVPLAFFDQVFVQPQLQAVFLTLTGSVSESVALTALRHALTRFPGVVVRNERQLAARQAANVTNVVDLLDALLVLALVMSLLGIGGALNLSVRARAGELGTLRALGMTPAQAAALIRTESALTALAGGVGGLILGTGLAVCLSHALAPEGLSFHVPWLAGAGALLSIVLAGGLAAIGPARRAARVSMLAAVTYE